MLEGKTIGVVVPAYNEERFIAGVLETMPGFVDAVIVVDDGSRDRTPSIIAESAAADPRIICIRHEENLGLGHSLVDGYLKARELRLGVTAVMAGDAQMSPGDLSVVVAPVAGGVDYVKGNRLLRPEVFSRMPKHRFFGNGALSLLSRFATGYWHILDPQCGYTAIGLKALQAIPIETLVRGYGYNAHLLNMLNLADFTVRDVPVEPVYGDARSGIKLSTYVPGVSWLLLRLFLGRLERKYWRRRFNPLILCYGAFFIGMAMALPLAARLLYFHRIGQLAPRATLTLLNSSLWLGLACFLCGIWLDMEDNRRLRG